MYRYETHLHTVEGSACGRTPGVEYPSIFKERGYDGIFITDHFFHGNTRPSRELSWPEYVDAYMKGYEEAKRAGDAIGFKVFFGIEENFEGDEFLIYGVDKQFLLDHPTIPHWTREEMIKWVHEAGGAVMQAHPFRERDYLSDIKLAPTAVDGIEVYNAANSANMNALGFEYCAKLDLPMLSGSDIHYFRDNELGGMLFDTKIASIEEFVSAVIARKGIPVSVAPDGTLTPVAQMREQTVSTELPTLEVLYPEGK